MSAARTNAPRFGALLLLLLAVWTPGLSAGLALPTLDAVAHSPSIRASEDPGEPVCLPQFQLVDGAFRMAEHRLSPDRVQRAAGDRMRARRELLGISRAPVRAHSVARPPRRILRSSRAGGDPPA